MVYMPFFPIVPFGGLLVFIALGVPLVLRSKHRGATGGAVLLAMALIFSWFLRESVERCAEIDRSPNGSCQMYGVADQSMALALLTGTGVVLSVGSALATARARAGSR